MTLHYALILRSSFRERIIYSVTEGHGHAFYKTTFNGTESTSGFKGLQAIAGKTEQLRQLTPRRTAHDANTSTKLTAHQKSYRHTRNTHTNPDGGEVTEFEGTGCKPGRRLAILSDFQILSHPSGKTAERLTHSMLRTNVSVRSTIYSF
jgi:hypothetical protein